MASPHLKWILIAGGALVLLVALAAGGGFWLLSAGMALAVRPGDPAPALALKDPSGGAVTLEQLRGKVVVLDFWASW